MRVCVQEWFQAVLTTGVIVLSAVIATPAGLRAETIEERLTAVEQKVQELTAENARLRSDLGVEGKAGMIVVKPAGKEPTLRVGGLLQAQMEAGNQGDARYSSDDIRFYLRRARMNLNGRFLEGFDFKVELDLSAGPSNTTALRASMTDGLITWTASPSWNANVGQFKTPYGFEQLYKDPELLFIERTLASDRVTVGRQLGVQVAANTASKRWSGAAGAFNGNGSNNNFNDNNHFLYAARVSGVVREGRESGDGRWTIGAAAYQSDDNGVSLGSEFRFDSTPATPERDALFTGDRLAWEIDSQFRAGRTNIWVEYLGARLEPDDDLPASQVDVAGGYVVATFDLVNQSLQGALRFDTFDPNRDVNSDTTDTWTLGMNWYLKAHDIKLQLNYVTADVPARSERQDKILARLQTIF